MGTNQLIERQTPRETGELACRGRSRTAFHARAMESPNLSKGRDMKTIILTQPVLERCESLANAYTRETLAALGVSWPPVHGWKRALLGREIPLANYERALAGRSKLAKKHAPLPEDAEPDLFSLR